jgi:hypothetical protein
MRSLARSPMGYLDMMMMMMKNKPQQMRCALQPAILPKRGHPNK